MADTLTKDILHDLKEATENRDADRLRRMTVGLHPQDLAQVVEAFTNLEDASFLLSLLEEETFAQTIAFLDETKREKLLTRLSAREIAEKVLENLDSDDATDVIQDLPEERQREVLQEIDDTAHAGDIAELLEYDEKSAGAIMAKELVKVPLHASLIQCVREIRRQAADTDDIYAVYVVDNDGILQGILPLKKLLLAPTNARLEDIIDRDVISVKATDSKEKAAELMRKYDLVVLPVVDGMGKLLGRITIDDVVDVIQEEAEKDYALASGLSENVSSADNLTVIARARLPWLLIGLAGGILGSRIIGQYEEQLQIHPEMAFFIPLIAAMGGNAGVQSSAIMVQALANQTAFRFSVLYRLLREFLTALLTGGVCAAALLTYGFVFTDNLGLSITVGTALLTVIIIASVMGTLIPLMLYRFKIDPAVATGPFITTSNDIVGLFVYFSVGRLMYGNF
ncbi:MAG: magnesium transporter [Flavobacteriales bacterium]|nr:magnesium transporter [Flavobacteriales bacterium]MCX7768777.1 magnesium transporter [Flavobacteriales bacterium]MDW8409429.1 magnesium transporter [Flavobacteriales bacterium]